MNVGLSISQSKPEEMNFYSNGMLQNIKFFYDLLKLCGFEPTFLNFVEEEQRDFEMHGNIYRCRSFQSLVDSREKFAVVFEVGVTIPQKYRRLVREVNKAKVVAVKYGNAMIMDLECMLFGTYQLGQVNLTGTDQVWYSPHFARSKYYFESIFDCEAIACPYLWEPDFVDMKPVNGSDEAPSIFVMEPNINVVKSALIPLCIVNELYKQDPNSFAKAMILNGLKLQKNQDFLTNVIANLPVAHADKNKVYFAARAKFKEVFSKKGILLGHHWENGLNYLYCEALYSGVPLVHNSEYFLGAGYYYPENQVQMGKSALQAAIDNFSNSENIEQHRQFLGNFSIHNPEVQLRYQKLISDVCE